MSEYFNRSIENLVPKWVSKF